MLVLWVSLIKILDNFAGRFLLGLKEIIILEDKKVYGIKNKVI